MKPKVLFLITFVALLLTNCNKGNVEERQPDNITPVEIGKGALYGNGQEGIVQSNMVITNTTDWQNLMNQMDSANNVTDSFTETNIDFSQFQIIAVFDEIRPHNNFDIRISNIIENTNNIEVYIDKTSGIEGYTVIIQPFYIVKIPKSNKPVVFIQN